MTKLAISNPQRTRLVIATCLIYFTLPAFSQQNLTVSVNVNGTKTAIASHFQGLAMNLPDAPTLVGTGSASNPYFVTLISNLTQYANGAFEIRLLSDEPYKPTMTSDILPAYSNFYNTMHNNSTYGVDYWAGVSFKTNFTWDTSKEPWTPTNTHLAADQATTLFTGLPSGSLIAYEIGNEPNLYTVALSDDETNDTDYERDHTWDYAEYISQYETVVSDIISKNTGITMAAPVFDGENRGISSSANIQSFINNESANLGLFVLHYYAGDVCGGDTEATDYLLTSNAINKPGNNSQPSNVATILSELAAAPTSRNNYRIGEMNSIACKGLDGVSNVFGSALWYLDQSMSYAQAGLSGVNLFELSYGNPPNYYSPFQFTQSGTGSTETWAISQINPIYYGMLALANFLQHDGALVPTTQNLDGGLVKAYAAIDNTKLLRVMLINKETTAAKDATITLTGITAGNGALLKLLATNNDYTTTEYVGPKGDYGQITYDGQTFQGSTDGSLQGTASYPAISPTNGNYVVTVPHSSMIVVKIQLP